MNPLLSKLKTLMHEYNPSDFNKKYNENLEFLTNQDQVMKIEEPVKNLESFEEIDKVFDDLNKIMIEKGFIDAQVYAYVYDNLCALVTTLADLKESNIEDFLKIAYVQQ